MNPTEPISFFVAGVPEGQPRARSFVLRGRNGKVIMSKTGQPILRVHDPHTAEAWKQAVALAAKDFVPMPPLSGPLSVTLQFVFPRPKAHYRSNGELKPNAPMWHTGKPDRDNAEKAVSDALKVLGMFDDDSQICAGPVDKRYGDAPGCQITIQRLGEAPAPARREGGALELRLEGVV